MASFRPAPRFAATAATAAIVATTAPPALAERTVSADEFADLVGGKTLHFERHGEPFGAEQYFPDGRVIWAFRDGGCERGIWFENASGQICFVYEGDPAPQCWDFLQMPSGDYHARPDGSDPAADLVTTGVETEALECVPGDVGV